MKSQKINSRLWDLFMIRLLALTIGASTYMKMRLRICVLLALTIGSTLSLDVFAQEAQEVPLDCEVSIQRCDLLYGNVTSVTLIDDRGVQWQEKGCYYTKADLLKCYRNFHDVIALNIASAGGDLDLVKKERACLSFIERQINSPTLLRCRKK